MNNIISKMLNRISLRVQLLLVFGVCVFISLFIIEVLSVSYIMGLSFGIKKKIEDTLFNSAINNLNAISKDSAGLIDREFEKSTENYAKVLGIFMADSFRSDYPFMNNVTSYWGFPGYLKTPLIFDQRYNNNISLGASSFNVYSKTPSSILTIEQSNTINVTSTTDSIQKPLYTLNQQFISSYVGFENDVFREYPGITDTNTQLIINYTPKIEDWYTIAIQNRGLIYSRPYYYQYLKQNMITFSQSIVHPETGVILGAMGADMILQSIGVYVKTLNYSASSRVVLFDIDGLVIADSLTTYPNIPNYAQIGLNISDDNWNVISNSSTLFISIGNSYVNSYTLSTNNGGYILAIFIPITTIKSTIDPIINQIYYFLIIYGSVVAFVIIVVIVLSLISVIILTNRIVQPLQHVVDDVTKMVHNIGSNNIVEGVKIEKDKFGRFFTIDETNDLQKKFNTMVSSLKKDQVIDDGDINPYYNTNSLPHFSIEIKLPQ